MESKQVNYADKLNKIVVKKWKASGINLNQVSKQTGIDHGNLWRYVHQRTYKGLKFDTAYKLVKFFGIDMSELEK